MITVVISEVLWEDVSKSYCFQCKFCNLKLKNFWYIASEQATTEATSKENDIKQAHCRYEIRHSHEWNQHILQFSLVSYKINPSAYSHTRACNTKCTIAHTHSRERTQMHTHSCVHTHKRTHDRAHVHARAYAHTRANINLYISDGSNIRSRNRVTTANLQSRFRLARKQRGCGCED